MASMELVVVLPWVPATTIERRSAEIAGRMSLRRSTGIRRSFAARTSGLCSGIAVLIATRSAVPTLLAS
jgi:hypothetical protein